MYNSRDIHSVTIIIFNNIKRVDVFNAVGQVHEPGFREKGNREHKPHAR